MTRTQAVLLATVEQCEEELRRSWGGYAYADANGRASFRSIPQVTKLLNALWGAKEALALQTDAWVRREARRRREALPLTRKA